MLWKSHIAASCLLLVTFDIQQCDGFLSAAAVITPSTARAAVIRCTGHSHKYTQCSIATQQTWQHSRRHFHNHFPAKPGTASCHLDSVVKENNNFIMTIWVNLWLQTLSVKICRTLLKQSFTASMPLLTATSAFRLGRNYRLWADAQRHGCPAEYRWHRLRKFHNSIPWTMPQSWLTPAAGVLCSNAAKIGECKTWT